MKLLFGLIAFIGGIVFMCAIEEHAVGLAIFALIVAVVFFFLCTSTESADQKAQRLKAERLERAWKTLEPGMSESQVRSLLGSPRSIKVKDHSVQWHYGFLKLDGVVTFEGGRVVGYSMPVFYG